MNKQTETIQRSVTGERTITNQISYYIIHSNPLLETKEEPQKTAQKIKFFIKDFYSFFRICSHLLKKSFKENFIFYAVEYS